MNPWRSFMNCPMIKQMLAEADGKDWSDVSVHEIRRLKPSLRKYTFAWVCGCGFEPDEIIAQENTPHIQLDGFRYYTGTAVAPFDTLSGTIHIANDAGTTVIHLDEYSQAQNITPAENETIHIFAKRTSSRILARYIISDAAMQTMRYFHGNKLQKSLIEAYMELPVSEQTAFAALATQAAIRRSTLYAMAYLASVLLCHRGSFASAELTRTAEVYNSQVCKTVQCDPLPTDWFLIFANNLFHNLPIREMGSTQMWQSPDIAPFAIYAVLNNCSIWHMEGHTTSSILRNTIPACTMVKLRDFIPTLAAPHKIDTLLDCVLHNYPEKDSDKTDIDKFLFRVLCSYETLLPEHFEIICDFLFRDTIYSTHVSRLSNVLDGPNGTAFRKYILDGFDGGCRRGIAVYHYCAAAITNLERTVCGKDALGTAVRLLNATPPRKDFLLNATCLSLILWMPRALNSPRITKKTLGLKPAAVDKLVSYLKKPDQLCYPIAANAVSDLIINELVEPPILDNDVRLSSIKALEDVDIRRRAEEILTLIPAKGGILPNDYRQLADRLKDGYLHRFEECLTNSEYEYDPEVLFATLCHLGLWVSDELCWQQLKRVCEYGFTHKKDIHNEQRWRIEFLIRQYQPCEGFWQPFDTAIDPMLLGVELSEQKEQQLRKLSEQLDDPSVAEQEITDIREALDIIKHLKPFAYPKRRPVYPTAKNLVARTRLNIPSAGSYIIVSWFRLLCIYNQGQVALEFYRCHQEILDAPYRICAPHQLDLRLYDKYASFRHQRKRVAEGICRSVCAGHTGVLLAFMNSEFRSIVDCEDFTASILPRVGKEILEDLERIYDGRFGTKEACHCKQVVDKVHSLQLEELLKRINEKIKELARLEGLDEPDAPSEANARPDESAPELPVQDRWVPSVEELNDHSPSVFYDDRTVLKYNAAKAE